jgi:hypothetical protein
MILRTAPPRVAHLRRDTAHNESQESQGDRAPLADLEIRARVALVVVLEPFIECLIATGTPAVQAQRSASSVLVWRAASRFVRQYLNYTKSQALPQLHSDRGVLP